ncbi:secondary thiamine-phosphate synthase enzyme YjbQ [Pseudoramibacter alactolyticus]
MTTTHPIMRKQLRTTAHTQMLDITETVAEAVRESGAANGIATVFVAHTTAAVTLNENTDPDVVRDMTREIGKIVPWEDGYHHAEGNSAAHLKASLFGASEQLIIENGRLVLGTWQGIYFAEFDGPRQRQFCIKIQADSDQASGGAQ